MDSIKDTVLGTLLLFREASFVLLALLTRLLLDTTAYALAQSRMIREMECR